MNDFREEWNLEMAVAVLGSATIEAGPWAEAVKWLLLYGPPELREMLTAASTLSFSQCFPEVRVQGHGPTGQPYYALADLAEPLGVPVADAADRLAELQSTLGVEFLVENDRVYKVN